MFGMEAEALIATDVPSECVGSVDINLHDTITAIDKSGERYPIDKLEAHIHNVPHVAISIFLFHGQRLMIQRRATTKYHSGGLWANTVCSHPRWNESISACAKRRLQEELGVSCTVRKFGEIRYEAKVGDLYENEQVHCLIGHLDERRSTESLLNSFNPVEVCEVAFLSLSEIEGLLKRHPQRITEWFKIYISRHRSLIDNAFLRSPRVSA